MFQEAGVSSLLISPLSRHFGVECRTAKIWIGSRGATRRSGVPKGTMMLFLVSTEGLAHAASTSWCPKKLLRNVFVLSITYDIFRISEMSQSSSSVAHGESR
jgi:hypothetical protein